MFCEIATIQLQFDMFWDNMYEFTLNASHHTQEYFNEIMRQKILQH